MSASCMRLEQIALRGLIARPAFAPSQLGDERRALQSEQACRCLLVALGASGRLLDESILDLLDGAVQVEAALREARLRDALLRDERADVAREVLDADGRLLGEDD